MTSWTLSRDPDSTLCPRSPPPIAPATVSRVLPEPPPNWLPITPPTTAPPTGAAYFFQSELSLTRICSTLPQFEHFLPVDCAAAASPACPSVRASAAPAMTARRNRFMLPPLFGNRVEINHGRKQHAGRSDRAEPVVQHLGDIAGAEEARQLAIHRQAEVGVAARQGYCVRLVRVVLLEHLQLVGIAGAFRQHGERDPVSGERRDLAVLDQREALCRSFYVDQLRVHA